MKDLMGLIEVSNFIGAAVTADAVFKNTDAAIEKYSTGNGSIILKISGEPESVRVAVEIGANAARQVGLLLAFNIIDDPSPHLNELFFNNKVKPSDNKEIQNPITKVKVDKTNKTELRNTPNAIKGSLKVKNHSTKKISSNILNPLSINNKNETENKLAKKTKNIENTLPLFDIVTDTITRLRNEALDNNESDKYTPIDDLTINEKEVNVLGEKEQQLKDEIDKMNVHELRHLARSIENFPIKGRVISKANRNELINHFKSIGY
jgi:microcompartment protein CcmL/EutN